MQIIRPTPDSSSKQGDSIETGSIIKLQHMRTRRWLHSHLHASPLSGNLEVSLYQSLMLQYSLTIQILYILQALFRLKYKVVVLFNLFRPL